MTFQLQIKLIWRNNSLEIPCLRALHVLFELTEKRLKSPVEEMATFYLCFTNLTSIKHARRVLSVFQQE